MEHQTPLGRLVSGPKPSILKMSKKVNPVSTLNNHSHITIDAVMCVLFSCSKHVIYDYHVRLMWVFHLKDHYAADQS